MIKRETLKTEQQNKNSVSIDSLTKSDVLTTINNEDQKVSRAGKMALPEIEKVVNYDVYFF